MSIKSSIASLFSGNTVEQPTQVAQATPTQAADITNQQPQQQQQSQVTTNQQAPFADLWNNDSDQSNKPQPLNFNLDQSKLADIANKIDYSAAISPDIKTRIASGGEDAVNAMMEALNIANRINYQHNAVSTAKLIEAAVQNTTASMETLISQKFKLMGLEDSTASNPALKNPAFAPLIETARQQIVAKHPNATSAELATMLNSYLQSLAVSVAPDLAAKANAPATPVTSNQQAQQYDWASILDINI